MRRLLLVGCTALACTSVQPPAPVPAPQTVYIHAPMDAVWASAVQFFADTRIPISTIDKASGLMASKDFEISAELFKRWGDCGTLKDGTPSINNVDGWMKRGMARAYSDFNVFVRPAGDSTAVRVNVGIRATAMNPMAQNRLTPVNCVASNGFQNELVEFIRRNAK